MSSFISQIILTGLRYARGMENSGEVSTVYRCFDAEEAGEALALLREAGIAAEIADDRLPGVPSGAFEVRVPASDAEAASALLREESEPPAQTGDASEDLDLTAVFRSNAHNAEMEALAVRVLLESSGIPAVVVGAPQYPVLPVEVRVPRLHAADAERIIEESRRAGPAAAEEGERESEA